MRSELSPLMPTFRSRHQADLLTILFLAPAEDHTVTELAKQLGIPLTTAHRELQRLEDAGLLTGRQVGRSRLLRANTAHRAFQPLAQLLLVTFGPHVVIADEFTGMPKVSAVIIFGSWAARYDGETGPAPADIDVLLVGSPNRELAYAAAERAESRLGTPVNPAIRSQARWDSSDDPLVESIRSSSYLDVTGYTTAGTANETAPGTGTVSA